MKAFDFPKLTGTLLILLLAVASCKQPETIVVDRSPETSAPADTSDADTVQTYPEEDFKQLNIGENQPLHFLDPLLASNMAEMHALQLVYEGLVRFDESGEITAAVADQWSSRNNNRSFTFNLRSDVYFHDSKVFGSGTGRELTSGDVKFVFERMARNNVPPQGALMFMNIEGMNAYYQEQRHIYNPEQRQLSGISGISTPNDTTVVFQLNSSDPNFLKRLATPRAVIYPREAVGAKPGAFTAAGTGPFTFSQQPNDTTYIFSKFNDYYRSSEINLNRVDVISSEDESALWEAMQNGNIHYLPAVGPQLAELLVSDEGTLNPKVTDEVELSKSTETELTLHRYFDAELSADSGADIAQLAEQDTTSLFDGMGPGISSISFSTNGSKLASMPNLQLQAVASDNLYATQLLNNLIPILSKKGASLSISKMRVPTRETALFVTEQWPLLSNNLWSDSPALLSFNISEYSLALEGVGGISQNRYPWWIDLRKIQLSDTIN